ncbi:abc multidrug transporter [Fusarium flagelliforme]|uniref:Abc multidrug transporter n=1 Tax=Fusarium flagelliforme TaxID=2675880 RepID=A0A395MVR3_9HYPO|nr:abc multidrug transporter [Fusarium flagelliforme]
MKLLCSVSPLCYEGNTDWSQSLKETVWAILESLLKTGKISASLRAHVVEAVLYFCERDSVSIRHIAVKQAKILLRKSMPYYLHASVVLFRSILHRADGELAKSEAHIRDFVWRGPRPTTRRDHALEGRIHISQTENKIKCYDNDVPSLTYKVQPHDTSSPLVILMQLRAVEILQSELDRIDKFDRMRRGFRRLMLALVEANIGLTRLDTAEATLQELLGDLNPGSDDIHDQQLHMRILPASARIAHLKLDPGQAVLR